jgi:type I site-specific restriction-modification system R (restriction) subunit
MAKKTQGGQPQTGAITGKFAVDLVKVKQNLEQEKAKAALNITKALAAIPKAVENIGKMENLLKGDFSELFENFDLESVEINQKIVALAEKEVEAEESLKDKEAEVNEKKAEIEKKHQAEISDLEDSHRKKLEEADYNFQKQIREKGENAAKKFLADRGLTSVSVVELNDLRKYEAETNEVVAEKIEKAVAEALAEKNLAAEHEKEMTALKHASQVELLEKEIENQKAIAGKYKGMLDSYQKKDEGSLNNIVEMIKAASNPVTNTINQDNQK